MPVHALASEVRDANAKVRAKSRIFFIVVMDLGGYILMIKHK
jgi:hypothetical protein